MIKNIRFFWILILGITLGSCEKTDFRPISMESKNLVTSNSDSCEEIISFVENHFPSLRIIKLELEKDEYLSYYDVYLTGNVNLEFNLQCEIIEIETKDGIPSSALPPSIVEYLSINFPNSIILEWELYPNYQEIKLNNGLEIYFDLKGNFIKLDD
jgi:hypothetical protein